MIQLNAATFLIILSEIQLSFFYLRSTQARNGAFYFVVLLIHKSSYKSKLL